MDTWRHDSEPELLYPELDGESLQERFLQGDHRAFEQIYYRFRDGLLRYAWVFSGSAELASDTVETAFQRFIQDPESGEAEQSFSLKRVLYGYVRNELNQHMDREDTTTLSPLRASALADDEDWTGPADEISLDEERRRVVEQLLSLSTEERDLLILYHLEGFSESEIEQGPDRTSGSFMSVYERGIEKLELEPEDIEACEEITLPPFPKGKESDLFSFSRERARELKENQEEEEEMDPDIKQILLLLPWGILLILALMFLPLLTNYFSSEDERETEEKTPVEQEGAKRSSGSAEED